jgi:hypothetical protein
MCELLSTEQRTMDMLEAALFAVGYIASQDATIMAFLGHAVAQWLRQYSYKPEGHGFETRKRFFKFTYSFRLH